MSGRNVLRYVLSCDGCGVELGEMESAHAARAAAYTAGWRFPPRVRGNGDDSLESSDVCPDCLPGWKPLPAVQARGKNKRRQQR